MPTYRGVDRNHRMYLLLGGFTLALFGAYLKLAQWAVCETRPFFIRVLEGTSTLGFDPRTLSSGPPYISVEARRMWTDSGIQIRAGDSVDIQASGKVNSCLNPNDASSRWVGPDGWGYQPQFFLYGRPNLYVPVLGAGSSLMCLTAKVGSRGAPFKVGRRFVFKAPCTGTLHLGVNDAIRDYMARPITSDEDIAWSDNAGAFKVYVRLRR